MVMPPPIEVASLGWEDSLILMVIALVVFGPRRLPEIGRQIGKLMYEVRKASNDFKLQMEEELRSAEKADLRKKEEERQKMLE
jgi:sec-independent protein translocase protein TatB